MAEVFLHLPVEDRREALSVAADRSGRPVHLPEKDVWVVWALSILYGSTLGEHLVFKGGTSLSKAYGIIKRFSEDVDLTSDIRHSDYCARPGGGQRRSLAEDAQRGKALVE